MIEKQNKQKFLSKSLALVALFYFFVSATFVIYLYHSIHDVVITTISVFTIIICQIPLFLFFRSYANNIERSHLAKERELEEELAIKESEEESEQLKIKNELFKSQQLLKQVLETIPQRIFWKDKDLKYLGCNKAFLEDLGMLDSAFIVGRYPEDVIENKAEAEFYTKTDAQVIGNDCCLVHIRQPFTIDGKTRWIDISKIPLHDKSGNVTGLLGAYEDITDRMVQEAELMKARIMADKANKAKSKFLADISHEIRTPMSGILGMTSVLNETTLSESQQQYVTAISRSAENTLQIVNDILDISKIEANKMVVRYSHIDIPELVKNLSISFKTRAKEKGIKFVLDIDDDIPLNIRGSALRINQIITNLVGNAMKFTQTGEVRLTVSTTKVYMTKCYIKFSVKDTGIGIDRKKIDIIFDSFTQENYNTTATYGGTGLGLPICKKLVQLMNGKMNVESKKGKGSIFSFELPFKFTKHNNEDTRNSKINCDDLADSQPKLLLPKNIDVLLADDDKINRSLGEQVLSGLKCNVSVAENGEEAVEMFRNKSFDIIFMDCQMPILDGYSAAKKIRELEGECEKRIPIIALTANAMVSARAKCIEAGMTDYIPKPIKKDVLIDVLNKLVVD